MDDAFAHCGDIVGEGEWRMENKWSGRDRRSGSNLGGKYARGGSYPPHQVSCGETAPTELKRSSLFIMSAAKQKNSLLIRRCESENSLPAVKPTPNNRSLPVDLI
jgi:hypothetical protein